MAVVDAAINMGITIVVILFGVGVSVGVDVEVGVWVGVFVAVGEGVRVADGVGVSVLPNIGIPAISKDPPEQDARTNEKDNNAPKTKLLVFSSIPLSPRLNNSFRIQLL